MIIMCFSFSFPILCYNIEKKTEITPTAVGRHLRKQNSHPWQRGGERGFGWLVEVGKMCYKIDTFGAKETEREREARRPNLAKGCQRWAEASNCLRRLRPRLTFEQALKVAQWANDPWWCNWRWWWWCYKRERGRCPATWAWCVVLAART